jgi:beta-glucosidase
VRAIDPVSIAGGIVAVAPDQVLLRVVDGSDEDEVLAGAQVAVVCVGLGPDREGEGFDRPYELPDDQINLIKRASRTSARVVVVLVAGGAVEMTSWVDDVDAILHLWYPGEIGARALAEILFGEVNPSGKLPVSVERRRADRAAVANYLPAGASLYDRPDYVSRDATPFNVRYAEGVFAGYRGLDALEIDPLYAFGHGLSYTRYEYGSLAAVEEGGRLVVRFTVSNTGPRDGLEAAQVYARPPKSLADAIPRRLVGFEKRRVVAGERTDYELSVPLRGLASWDGREGDWHLAAGTYTIEVGASSRDVRLSVTVELAERRISCKAGVL